MLNLVLKNKRFELFKWALLNQNTVYERNKLWLVNSKYESLDKIKTCLFNSSESE